MANGGAGRRQPQLPTRRVANSLWCGCRWAVCLGAWHGRTQSGTLCANDTVSKNRGFLSGIAGTTQILVRAGGRAVSSNAAQTGVVWVDYVKIPVPQEGIYSWLNTGGMTLACLVRVVAVPNSNRRVLTKRFGTAANFHGGALSFNNTNGNKFEFSYCDGVTTQSIFGTTTPVAGGSYLLIGRHWGNNVNSRAELWVNGKMEAVNAAPATYPAYHSDPPITFFNDTGSGDLIFNGEAYMGALWRRPLSTSEINRLNTDPYIMWKLAPNPQGLPGKGAIDGCRCGGPWLHAWSGLG